MKVLLGFSGGVDSSVAAHLLKERGYDVTACFMRNWDSIANNDIRGNPTLSSSKCTQELDYDDALKAAAVLKVPLIRRDFIDAYWNEVFTAFLEAYRKGVTPNPDVFCNRFVKFGSFLEFARSQGFDTIAMGHYAKRVLVNGVDCLAKPKDLAKDQTYFLSMITPEQIRSCLFPMSDITKEEARRLARKLGLDNADKRGSTGVCFIGERNFRPFLENYIPPREGDVVDAVSQRVVGRHEGVSFYTVGQHKGLGIGGVKGLPDAPFFVVGKDVKKNILYVAQEEGNRLRFSSSCTLVSFNWIGPWPPSSEADCWCKFRYRQKDNPVRLEVASEGKEARLSYRACAYVAPGQIACLYSQEGICLGGGIVQRADGDGQNLLPREDSPLISAPDGQ